MPLTVVALVAAGRGFYIVAPPLFADPPLLWLTTLVTMHLCLRLAPLLSMLLVAYWDGISGAAGTPAAKHPPRWQAASVGYPSPEEGELASRFFENPHLWGGDPVMAVPKEEEEEEGRGGGGRGRGRVRPVLSIRGSG
eukprot:COSAG01_NODE_8652_length_2707_cov_2.180215_3_plen_137_part_01